MLWEDSENYRGKFFEIVQDCRGGITTKERALQLLEGALRFCLIDPEEVRKYVYAMHCRDNPEARICETDLQDWEIKQAEITNALIKNEYTRQKNEIDILNEAPEILPTDKNLEKLIEGDAPVLRKWTGGKYKCGSLERFIKAYQNIADNLSPALIRDYLLSERSGKPYAAQNIEKRLAEHRIT